VIEIGLVRHFPTDWNAAGRLQGRTDVPLSEAARAELAGRRLPTRWRGLPIIASPLRRARETAEALAEGAPVRIEPRLIEFDFGDWEGRIGAELIAEGVGYGPVEGWGADFAAPGGETVAMLEARVEAALGAIGAPAVVVTHRGVMRAALALATGWRWRGPEPFRIKRAAVHPLRLEGGRIVGAAPWERLDRR
jgi:probable phosphoglycerate mutase